MTVEELNEEDLFNEAVSDEPAETLEPSATETEQPEPTETVAEATTETERPAVDDNAPLVPSWRLREINEEKRTLADRLAALEAEKSQWQRQAPPKPAEPEKEKAAKPDPLLDPDGYEKYLEQKFEEKQLNRDREISLKTAHKVYKTEFEEAYAAAQKHIDPALKARMQQSEDAGETLMQWHRERKTMQEVGTDPNAWLEKKLEERLKDPTFLAKAVELARGSAPQQNNGRPRVELPPSLNGASRSNSALKSSNDDVSDHELFELTTNG